MAKKKKQPETVTEVVYALRHIKSGKLLTMQRTSNADAEFCNDHTVRLEEPYGDPEDWDPDTWYIDTILNAEYVRNFSTEWYNSGERTPQHYFKPEELEVVQVERTVKTVQVKAKVPTFEEYMELRYREKEPAHCDYVLKEYRANPDRMSHYSLYDLMMLAEEGKWDPGGPLNV